MKKLIIFVFILIFFTGCDVEYNLVVDNKKHVSAEVTIKDSNVSILKNTNNIDEFLYEREQEFDDSYVIKRLYKDEESGLLIKAKFNDLESFTESELYKRAFNISSIVKDKKFFTFSTLGEYDRNSVFSVPFEATYSYMVDSVKINIKFYNEVYEHNADQVNEKENIYTWILDKDNLNEIILFKLSDKVRYDVMIKDIINRHKVAIIVSIAVIIGIIIGILNLKKIIRKNNSI